MNPENTIRESSLAKVQLLKGQIYQEDEVLWRIVRAQQEPITRYFADIGLDLHINEPEGMAYLKQRAWPGGESPLPQLFRRDELTYPMSVLGAVARDELHKHQQIQPDNPRLIEEIEAIANWIAPYFGKGGTDAKDRRELYSIVRKGARLGLLRKVKDDSAERYEVSRIIKLLFPLEDLGEYLQRLRQARGAVNGEDGDEQT
ncbi:MAG TPA: DUF4194 domain-containing protein [Opitutaceae bacterium]|nr:DUF4194 domain-containing protein [Opitutaceae bacterium]HRJ46201.1 DUF4194 domain-containing protein [Opitutaceae bacterium]